MRAESFIAAGVAILCAGSAVAQISSQADHDANASDFHAAIAGLETTVVKVTSLYNDLSVDRRVHPSESNANITDTLLAFESAYLAVMGAFPHTLELQNITRFPVHSKLALRGSPCGNEKADDWIHQSHKAEKFQKKYLKGAKKDLKKAEKARNKYQKKADKYQRKIDNNHHVAKYERKLNKVTPKLEEAKTALQQAQADIKTYEMQLAWAREDAARAKRCQPPLHSSPDSGGAPPSAQPEE